MIGIYFLKMSKANMEGWKIIQIKNTKRLNVNDLEMESVCVWNMYIYTTYDSKTIDELK